MRIFKYSITLFLIIILANRPYVAGQSAENEELKKTMWKEHNDLFTANDLMRWKDESAIILYRDYEYRYVQQKSAWENSVSYRYRIKLMDNASVEEFSEFSFESKEQGKRTRFAGNLYVGLKIVKPDGREIELDMNEAVTKEISSESERLSYKKIALPNLEVGDIVDYYYSNVQRGFYSAAYPKVFEPEFFPLRDRYPIVNQDFKIVTNREIRLNARECNGAPKLNRKQIDPKEDHAVYHLNESDQPKLASERWAMEYRDIPLIKFQAYLIEPIHDKGYFIAKPARRKNNISPLEIVQYARKEMLKEGKSVEFKLYRKNVLKKIIKWIDNHPEATKSEEDLAEALYYAYRQFNRLNSLQLETDHNSLFTTGSNGDFIRRFKYLLDHYKISADLVVTVPRNIGVMDDLVLPAELDYLIRLNLKSPVFISNPSGYSQFGEISPYHERNDALAINISDSKDLWKAVPIQIRQSDHHMNKEKSVIEVIPIVDGGVERDLKINYFNEAFGHNRAYEQSLCVTLIEYLSDSKYEEYNIDIDDFDPTRMSAKSKAELLKNLTFRHLKRTENVLMKFQSELDFKIDEIEDFELVNTGLWPEENAVSYKASFSLKDAVTKAGPNYLLPLGKLIGAQVELDEMEKDRQYNVQMGFPRSFHNIIKLKIPEGYAPKGMESFNKSEENDTGGFVSSARIEDGYVVLEVRKYYINQSEPADNWEKMKRFLDLAYDFTQQKLLLTSDEKN